MIRIRKIVMKHLTISDKSRVHFGRQNLVDNLHCIFLQFSTCFITFNLSVMRNMNTWTLGVDVTGIFMSAFVI